MRTTDSRARVVTIDSLDVSAYRVPTDRPESDGTLAWTSTTIVVVEASAGGKTGIGYTYADRATALLIKDLLAPIVVDGVLTPAGGAFEPDLGRPGNGLEFKRDDAQRYAV
jgi:hypothetical protein